MMENVGYIFKDVSESVKSPMMTVYLRNSSNVGGGFTPENSLVEACSFASVVEDSLAVSFCVSFCFVCASPVTTSFSEVTEPLF